MKKLQQLFMLPTLSTLSTRGCYWLGLAFFALSLEVVALIYQYALSYPPCVYCIHVRLWVAALFVLGLLGYFLRRSRVAILSINFLVLAAAFGFAERAYQTLAVERLWTFGSCSMDAGLPGWFALDRWLPWVFEVQAACGYTPVMLFDVTMAEYLMGISALLVLVALAVGVASSLPKKGA